MASPPVFTMLQKSLSVISLVEQGYSVSDACDRVGITYADIHKALDANEPLRNLFVSAERRSYDIMADALLNIDQHRIYGQTDAKMAAVISRNIQWYLSKRRATIYGDKITVEHTITADKEILEALQRGKARAHGKLLDAEQVAAPALIDRTGAIDIVPVVEEIKELF